jgi:hypothetical protein
MHYYGAQLDIEFNHLHFKSHHYSIPHPIFIRPIIN